MFVVMFAAACTNSTNQEQQGSGDSTAATNQLAELEKKLGTDTLAADSLREGLVEKLVESNQVNKAIAQIDLLLKKQPNSPAYLFMKADALERKADTTGAIEYYGKAVTAAGSFADAELRLANLYAETGNPLTLKLCDVMLKQTTAVKMRSDVLMIKGIYYTKIKDSKNAFRIYDQVIREDYSYLDAYIEKGLVYYDQGKFAEAHKLFEKSTDVSNAFADGYFWMAKAEEKMNKTKEAIDNYKRSLALDQSIEEARDALKRLGAVK
jgi:tetratricopeptide (TPR) repeat protein